MKIALDDRAINFAKLVGSGRIFDADDDAIGMEEIVDGGAFAQELRVGGHAELHSAAA
jgi:hypothetical protein